MKVLNIDDMLHVNQFMQLQGGLSDFIITQNSSTKINCSELRLNYDVNIKVEVESKADLLPFMVNKLTRTVHMRRYSKLNQSVLLNLSMSKYPGFRNLKCYDISDESCTLPDGKYIIKPVFGARRLSIISVDVGKYNIRRIIKLISDSFKKN